MMQSRPEPQRVCRVSGWAVLVSVHKRLAPNSLEEAAGLIFVDERA